MPNTSILSALSALPFPHSHAIACRDPEGFDLPEGGIAYNGRITVGNLVVATFQNDGDGGCNAYTVMRGPLAQELWAIIEAEARAEFPMLPEPTDYYVGLLWDTAMLKPQVPAACITGARA